ncbi:hypothetical protein BKA70DRAFT_1323771, partial [Coprinopsis sp. MPI-PUGE-AT-0042]
LLRPAKLRSLTGPLQGSGRLFLPIDILKAYCRPLIFETIFIGSINLPPGETQRTAVNSLHRLAIALQRSPDIANFFKNINIRWMPSYRDFSTAGGFQRYEAEALFSFILDRPLPELGFNSLPCIQTSLLTIVAAPKIIYLNLVMASFPNTILERSRAAGGMTLSGNIYLDPTRPQLPFTVDPHIVTPTILTIYHVPDHSLSLLTKEQSPRFDSCNIRVLRLHGSSGMYSARQNAIVLRAAAHLFHVNLTVTDWANTTILFPLHKLDALVCLELEVFAFQASAAIRSLDSSEDAKPLDIICITMIGRQDLPLQGGSQTSILDRHKMLWKEAVDECETSWPELKGFPIHGMSRERAPGGDQQHGLGWLTKRSKGQDDDPKQRSRSPVERTGIN